MIGIGFLDDLISEVGMPLVKKGVEALTGIDLSKEELTPEDKTKMIDFINSIRYISNKAEREGTALEDIDWCIQ